VARPTERYQANPLNPAEYRTVWNNWHVDLSGVDRIQTTTKTASDLSSGPVDVDEGWIDAPRGVLHSVHQDQQPTRNYGDRQYRLIRPDHRGQPQVAKSAETDPERHEIVEPISNTRTSVTENDTDPAARTRRSGLAEPVASVRETLSGRREEFERMMTNKPRDVDQMAVVDQEANKRQREAPTVSPSQNADEQRQYQRPQQQQVLLQQQQQRSSSLDDGTLVLEEYGELADNGTEEAEVLEYPYNQEFSSHPVDWSPMEYIVEDVPSEYTPSPAMKQAPAEVADKADSFDSKDYPYNQYKERILADESYADYSESAGSLKEGGSEVEEHVTQPDEAVDKTLSIDYPYNQLFLIDGFANPTANDEDVNSTSFNLPPQPTKSSDTVRYTVHSDVKTPLSSSPSRHHEPHVKQGDDRRLRTDGDDVHVLPVPTAAADRQVPAGADRYIVHREQHGYEPHQDRHPLLPPSQTPPVLPTAAVPQPHPPEQRHHQQSDSADRPASGAGAVKEVLHTKSTVHRLPVSPLDAAPDAYQHVPVEVPRAAAAAEIAPLRTKDGFGGFPPHRRSGHGRDGDRKSRGPLAKEASDDGVDYEKVDEIISQYNPQHIGQQNCMKVKR
jgi:hypothetical protein